jgi:Tol biopolymer transport system component
MRAPGACDPAWSPDGKRLAVTDADGLGFFQWIRPAVALVAESKLPPGQLTDYTYRAFSRPGWSPDGMLVALVVTNAATSWVEVFDSRSGTLFYTSPPESFTFRWGPTSRDLKVGDLDVRLPAYPPTGR